MAALANSWSALAFGFAGMRTYGGALSFHPRYFAPLGPYSLRITFRGRLIQITVNSNRVAYELLEGEPVEFSHDGTTCNLKSSFSFSSADHGFATENAIEGARPCLARRRGTADISQGRHQWRPVIASQSSALRRAAPDRL